MYWRPWTLTPTLVLMSYDTSLHLRGLFILLPNAFVTKSNVSYSDCDSFQFMISIDLIRVVNSFTLNQIAIIYDPQEITILNVNLPFLFPLCIQNICTCTTKHIESIHFLHLLVPWWHHHWCCRWYWHAGDTLNKLMKIVMIIFWLWSYFYYHIVMIIFCYDHILVMLLLTWYK